MGEVMPKSKRLLEAVPYPASGKTHPCLAQTTLRAIRDCARDFRGIPQTSHNEAHQ